MEHVSLATRRPGLTEGLISQVSCHHLRYYYGMHEGDVCCLKHRGGKLSMERQLSLLRLELHGAGSVREYAWSRHHLF